MQAIYYVTIVVIVTLFASLIWANNDPQAPLPILILTFGALGAVVREHIDMRAQILSEEPIKKTSNILICLSPVVGGLLAFILMSLLLSGMISGDLFPKFINTDADFTSAKDVFRGGVTLESNSDFYKLMAWSIIAGYSEKIVLSRLDGLANNKK